MNRCDSCRDIATCPLCSKTIDKFVHLGVRGTTKQLTIPVVDYKITYDE